MNTGVSPWVALFRVLQRARAKTWEPALGMALLDLSGLTPELRRGSEHEVHAFLRRVLQQVENLFPDGSRGVLLDPPLIGLVFPLPQGVHLGSWLAEIGHRAQQIRLPWKSKPLPLRGRLVATQVDRQGALETLAEVLLEQLHLLPSGAWTWVPSPPPPSDWERFWTPWLESWPHLLHGRRVVIWLTGGTSLDREIVLDLLRRFWSRWGFSQLRSCPHRARHHPYGALLDGLHRYTLLYSEVPKGPWRRLLEPEATYTQTQARTWLTEAVLALSSAQPLLILIPEFQQWAPESQHVLKHLIRTGGNFSLVITSAHLPEPSLRGYVHLATLPDLREMLTPAALGSLFPGLHYPEVLSWLMNQPSTHRLHCLRVLYALRGPQALEGLESDPEAPARKILEALSATERRFLHLLSPLSEPLDLPLLQEITDLPSVEIGTLLHRLTALHILRTDGQGGFVFPNTPLRKLLLRSLKAERKQEVHRRALRVLESRTGPFVDSLRLPHLLAVGRYGQAFNAYLALADQSFRKGAPLSGLKALQRAVRLARFDPSLREILNAALNLRHRLPHPNRLEALPAALREARSLAEDLEALGEPEHLLPLGYWIGRLLLHMGRYEEAEELGRQLYQQAEVRKNPEFLALALEILGLHAWYREEVPRAMVAWKQALVHAQEAQCPTLMARILGNLGMAYQQQHRYPLALKHYVGALRIYNREGDRPSVGIALGMIGHVFRHWGLLDRALQYYRRAAHVSQQVGDMYHAVVWKAEEGFLFTDLALWEEGMPRLLEALTSARSIEATYLLANLQVEILQVQARRGYRSQALAGLERLIQRLRQRGIHDLELRARLYRIRWLTETGRWKAARAALQETEALVLSQYPQFQDPLELEWIRFLNATRQHRQALARFPRWFRDLKGPIPSGPLRLSVDALRAETLVHAEDPRAGPYLEQAWKHVLRLARHLPSPQHAQRFLQRHPEVQRLRALRDHFRPARPSSL